MSARQGEIVCPHTWDDGLSLHFCYLPQEHDEPLHICACGNQTPVEIEE